MAFVGTTSAQAQLPPEVTDLLDQLPPEVQDPVNQAVADALTALVGANIEGIGQANSAPGASSASAVDFPGLVTVNKSETTKSSSKVTRLSVGGQDLLVKNGDANGGTNSGDLAAAGDLVDGVNKALCPYGSTGVNACTTVLEANATSTGSPTTSANNVASSSVLRTETTNGDGVAVLPNRAQTTKLRILGRDRCIDVAQNSLLGGRGVASAASIVGLKIKIGGVLAPC